MYGRTIADMQSITLHHSWWQVTGRALRMACGPYKPWGIELIYKKKKKQENFFSVGGNGLNWSRNHRQIVCTFASHVTRRGGLIDGATLGSYMGQPLKGELLLDLGLLPDLLFTSWMTSTLLSVHEYWTTCIYFAWYCWEPVTSNFACL